MVDTPVTIEVDFKNTGSAHMAPLIPGVERTGPRTIAITGDNYLEVFRTFTAALLFGFHSSEGKL